MGAANFEWPTDPSAIIADLAKFLPDTPEFKRVIADVTAKLHERDRAVEDVLTVPTGTVPVYTADPAVLTDGMEWINSTSGQLKVRMGGATRVVTVV